tara:strand:+ start:1173 stop:1484 length:312 start_codon:yes stop_codon:yes gene_type:complete
MTITKNTLIEMLHDEVGLNKREAKEFIEMFFESLKKNLENGNDIKISGFGNFTLRDKNARPGRNPKTGEEVLIKERRVVTFKSGLKLKNKLEAYEDKIDEQSG